MAINKGYAWLLINRMYEETESNFPLTVLMVSEVSML